MIQEIKPQDLKHGEAGIHQINAKLAEVIWHLNRVNGDLSRLSEATLKLAEGCNERMEALDKWFGLLGRDMIEVNPGGATAAEYRAQAPARAALEASGG